MSTLDDRKAARVARRPQREKEEALRNAAAAKASGKGRSEKPLAKGTVHGIEATDAVLPPKGKIKRYILTSAQNNTFVHEGTWKNILALAAHYNAEIFVGTFSYDQNSYGQMAVKQGTFKGGERKLWYDERLTPYMR